MSGVELVVVDDIVFVGEQVMVHVEGLWIHGTDMGAELGMLVCLNRKSGGDNRYKPLYSEYT